MLLSLVDLAESTHGSEGVNPYVVGGVTLGLLLFLLFVVTGIGSGREHT